MTHKQRQAREGRTLITDAHERSPCGQARDRLAKLRADRSVLKDLVAEREAMLTEVLRRRKETHFTASLGEISKRIMQQVTLERWLRESKEVWQVALEHEINVAMKNQGEINEIARDAFNEMVANEHPGMGSGMAPPLEREQNRKMTLERSRLTIALMTADPDTCPTEAEQKLMNEEHAQAVRDRWEREKAAKALGATSIYGPDTREPGTAPDEEEWSYDHQLMGAPPTIADSQQPEGTLIEDLEE